MKLLDIWIGKGHFAPHLHRKDLGLQIMSAFGNALWQCILRSTKKQSLDTARKKANAIDVILH
jgi:hypothetical protein